MKENTAMSKIARISSGCMSIALVVAVIAGIVGIISADAVASTVAKVSLGVAVLALVVYVVADFRGVIARLKEALRKFLVSLKRSPSMIPLAMMLVAFLVYSLNLTDISNTTAKIQGSGMGLSEFCIMLFSLLSMVCMLNAFPKRKKANMPMVILMYAMFAIIIFCDIHYNNAITAALTRAESPIQLSASTVYIADAYNMLNTHMILIIVTAVLIALLPVYSKLLRKINTSVEVEDNGDMAEIELND